MVLMGSLQGKFGKRGGSVLRSLDYPLNLFLSIGYRDTFFFKGTMQISQSGIIHILDVNNLFTEKKFMFYLPTARNR